jgi:hypothetical protein
LLANLNSQSVHQPRKRSRMLGRPEFPEVRLIRQPREMRLSIETVQLPAGLDDRGTGIVGFDLELVGKHAGGFAWRAG